MGTNSSADASAFRAAALNGQIGVDPDAAQTVLNKIRRGKDAVENLLNGSGSLAEAPKLGANPVGQAISTKFSQRADGGATPTSRRCATSTPSTTRPSRRSSRRWATTSRSTTTAPALRGKA